MGLSGVRWAGALPRSPAAKERQELPSLARREVVVRQTTQCDDRLAELSEIARAGATSGQVLLETDAIRLGEGAVEILRDDLDQLLAGHLGHLCPPRSKYCSSAMRTLERARWRSTR